MAGRFSTEWGFSSGFASMRLTAAPEVHFPWSGPNTAFADPHYFWSGKTQPCRKDLTRVRECVFNAGSRLPIGWVVWRSEVVPYWGDRNFGFGL